MKHEVATNDESSNQSPAPIQSITSEIVDIVRCDCGKTWTRPNVYGNHGYQLRETCDDCAQKKRSVSWSKICPHLYLSTDRTRLPQEQLKLVMEWEWSPQGLLLSGPTGRGKSRCAWLRLEREYMDMHDPRNNFFAFDCVSFGHECAKHFRGEDGEEWALRVANADIVFFDDLGKLKMTERAEAELFGVVERRCAKGLPIIATTNDTGDTLAARMTDNRGPALIRRLREFCDVVSF